LFVKIFNSSSRYIYSIRKFNSHSYISNIQALPVRDGKQMNFLNASNAIYEGNGEKLLSNKNISLIPYFITEQKYIENGLLNGVENVTNTQTYLNAHISDDILLGKGNGTIETMDGQNITWISSDIGRQIDNKWLFNGITLFNNTESDSLSILNNSIALTKSESGPILADYMWLLE
jgi:hypothetical protein